MNNNFIQKVIDIINIKIGIESKPETVAFLGLTSKSEAFYRDVIALSLNQIYGKKYLVSREWNRCDIAILDFKTGLPIFLLELKVCYNVDLYKQSTIKEYINAIDNDLKKCIKHGCAESYSIMFIFKPKKEIPKNLFSIVKYHKAINSGIKKIGFKELDIRGRSILKDKFKNMEFYHICEDESYNIQCELDICVVKVE